MLLEYKFSPSANEKTVSDFFSFCGKINQLYLKKYDIIDDSAAIASVDDHDAFQSAIPEFKCAGCGPDTGHLRMSAKGLELDAFEFILGRIGLDIPTMVRAVGPSGQLQVRNRLVTLPRARKDG